MDNTNTIINQIIDGLDKITYADLKPHIAKIERRIGKLKQQSLSYRGLVISEIIKNKDGRKLTYKINNIDDLLIDDLLVNLYALLYKNSRFNSFSRNKIVTIKAAISEEDVNSVRYVTLTDNILCKYMTTLEEFMDVANKYIYKHHIGGYVTDGIYHDIEVTVWKQKIHANRNIKYTTK